MPLSHTHKTLFYRRLRSNEFICSRRMSKHLKSDSARRKDMSNRLNIQKDMCVKAIDTYKDELNKRIETLKKSTIAQLDERIKCLKASEKDSAEIKFEKNDDIKELLDTISTLGTCLISSTHDEFDDTDEIEEDIGCQPCKVKEDVRQPFKVTKVEKHTVPLVDSKQLCSFTSCVIIGQKYILLVDNTNNMMYMIDKFSYVVKSWLELSGSPWFITKVNDTKVIVSIVEGNESWLQFIDIENDSLKEANKLTMSHWCIGVIVLKDQLFVTDLESSIHVYTLQGKFCQKYESKLLSCPLQICLSRTKQFIYIVDRNKGLVSFNIKNSSFHQLDKMNFSECWDVTIDDIGNKYVSDSSAHKVIIVTPKKKQFEILTEKDGLKQPKAVCYDSINGKLYVTCNHSNELFIVSMQQL
ncbi:hypothetical protein ACF0H5_007912 [Mactra antiquata]